MGGCEAITSGDGRVGLGLSLQIKNRRRGAIMVYGAILVYSLFLYAFIGWVFLGDQNA